MPARSAGGGRGGRKKEVERGQRRARRGWTPRESGGGLLGGGYLCPRLHALHHVQVHLAAVKVGIVRRGDGEVQPEGRIGHDADAVRHDRHLVQRRLAVKPWKGSGGEVIAGGEAAAGHTAPALRLRDCPTPGSKRARTPSSRASSSCRV
eukprot:scaffold4556_cov114-Isochrysis_galbana.AAC.9